MTLSFSRWQRVSQSLAIAPDAATFGQLQQAYRSPHRHYHTTKHILHCLSLLDDHRRWATHPAEVELALWFHDAVYDTRATDNEAKSAAWADHYLQQQRASPASRQRIVSMILSTAGHCPTVTSDARLLLDIDLSILGQEAPTFAQYDQAIRAEYVWVPLAHYCEKRRAILQAFLERDFIYQTLPFCQRYEAVARHNLTRLLETML